MTKGKRIGELLVQAGILDPMQLQSALGHQKRWSGKIGKHLVELGFIEEDIMLKFLSETFKMKAVNLVRSRISPETFETVPKDVARKYEVVPVVAMGTGNKRTIVLAMSDPTDLVAIDQIQFLTGAKVEPVLATDSAISIVLDNYGIFTPEMAKEVTHENTASPSQLRKETKNKITDSQTRPGHQGPDASRDADEEIAISPDEDIEVIKDDIFMLKTTRPTQKKPLKPVLRDQDSLPKPQAPTMARDVVKKPQTRPRQIRETYREEAGKKDDSPFLLQPEEKKLDSPELKAPETPIPEILEISPVEVTSQNQAGMPEIEPSPLPPAVPEPPEAEPDFFVPPSPAPEALAQEAPPIDEAEILLEAPLSDDKSSPGDQVPELSPDQIQTLETADQPPGPEMMPEMEKAKPKAPAIPEEDKQIPAPDPPNEETEIVLADPHEFMTPDAYHEPEGPEVGDEQEKIQLADPHEFMAPDAYHEPEVPEVGDEQEKIQLADPHEFMTPGAFQEPGVPEAGGEPEEIKPPPDIKGAGVPELGIETQPESIKKEETTDGPVLEPAQILELDEAKARLETSAPPLPEEFLSSPGSHDLGNDLSEQGENGHPDEPAMEEPAPEEPIPETPSLDLPPGFRDQKSEQETATMPEPPAAGESGEISAPAPADSDKEEVEGKEDIPPAPPEEIMQSPDDDLWGAPSGPEPGMGEEQLTDTPADDHGDLPPLPDLGELTGEPVSAPPAPFAQKSEVVRPPGLDIENLDFEAMSVPGTWAPAPEKKTPVASLSFEGPPADHEETEANEKGWSTSLPEADQDEIDPQPEDEGASDFLEAAAPSNEPAPPQEPDAAPPPDNSESLFGEDVNFQGTGADAGMEPEPVPQAAPEPEATPEPEPASEPQQDNDIPLVQELVDQPAPVEADEVESDLPDATTAGEEPEQDVPEILGEFKQVEAPLEESSQVELTKDELGRLEDLGEHFLDTKEVKKSISLIADMDQGIKEREYQFDELLSLMMKKELGEITQELFMNELGELKKKVDESRKKK